MKTSYFNRQRPAGLGSSSPQLLGEASPRPDLICCPAGRGGVFLQIVSSRLTLPAFLAQGLNMSFEHQSEHHQQMEVVLCGDNGR